MVTHHPLQLGTPLTSSAIKVMMLGSGELGKEFTIAAQRIGQTIIAVDSYENAPAMQVAHGFEVINMLDGEALDRIVAKHQPDFIVPEIEAIRTERFYDYEKHTNQNLPTNPKLLFLQLKDVFPADANLLDARLVSPFFHLNDMICF